VVRNTFFPVKIFFCKPLFFFDIQTIRDFEKILFLEKLSKRKRGSHIEIDRQGCAQFSLLMGEKKHDQNKTQN